MCFWISSPLVGKSHPSRTKSRTHFYIHQLTRIKMKRKRFCSWIEKHFRAKSVRFRLYGGHHKSFHSFRIQWNEIEQAFSIDSFCTRFRCVFSFAVPILRVCKERKKTCPIPFLLSTQRFQCNKGHSHTHFFFTRMQWFIVSWLENHITFVFVFWCHFLYVQLFFSFLTFIIQFSLKSLFTVEVSKLGMDLASKRLPYSETIQII